MIPSNQTTNKLDEYDFSALNEIAPKQITLNEALREVIFYILPILGFLFFLFVLFNGVIPTLNKMNENIAKIETLKQEDASLQTRIDKIYELENKIAETQEIIDKINSIVPTGRTEVVAFGGRIILNITGNGLSYEDISSGELEYVNTSVNDSADDSLINPEEDPTYLPLYQIPTKFSIKGPYEGIRSFFKDIYKGQDFFIVGEMELIKVSNNEWNGDISLTKYQFSPNNNAFDPNKAYLTISEDAGLNQEVLDFLEKKFINDAFIQNAP